MKKQYCPYCGKHLSEHCNCDREAAEYEAELIEELEERQSRTAWQQDLMANEKFFKIRKKIRKVDNIMEQFENRNKYKEWEEKIKKQYQKESNIADGEMIMWYIFESDEYIKQKLEEEGYNVNPIKDTRTQKEIKEEETNNAIKRICELANVNVSENNKVVREIERLINQDVRDTISEINIKLKKEDNQKIKNKWLTLLDVIIEYKEKINEMYPIYIPKSFLIEELRDKIKLPEISERQ